MCVHDKPQITDNQKTTAWLLFSSAYRLSSSLYVERHSRSLDSAKIAIDAILHKDNWTIAFIKAEKALIEDPVWFRFYEYVETHFEQHIEKSLFS